MPWSNLGLYTWNDAVYLKDTFIFLINLYRLIDDNGKTGLVIGVCLTLMANLLQTTKGGRGKTKKSIRRDPRWSEIKTFLAVCHVT